MCPYMGRHWIAYGRAHDFLAQKAGYELMSRGFKVTFEKGFLKRDATKATQRWRVDVYGEKGEKKVIIEVGHIQIDTDELKKIIPGVKIFRDPYLSDWGAIPQKPSIHDWIKTISIKDMAEREW